MVDLAEQCSREVRLNLAAQLLLSSTPQRTGTHRSALECEAERILAEKHKPEK